MVTRLAVQGCAVPGLGMDQAVFAVVGKALQGAIGAASFAEVAQGVVAEVIYWVFKLVNYSMRKLGETHTTHNPY